MHAQHADEQGALPYRWEDLDPNAMLHLIVDSIDQKKDCVGDKRPYTKLMTELVCCLAATLPSLAMETGSASKAPLENAHNAIAGLGFAMEAAMSGTPLLFLDLRERNALACASSDSRARPGKNSSSAPQTMENAIAEAKAAYEAKCDTLLAKELAECMDCCDIAHYHEVLAGGAATASTESSATSCGRKPRARRSTQS